LKRVLRYTSFAFPASLGIIAGLLLYEVGFTVRATALSFWEVSISVYLAIFLNKRSHNREASFFYVSNGPDRDQVWQLWVDAAALGVAASILLMALVLFLKLQP